MAPVAKTKPQPRPRDGVRSTEEKILKAFGQLQVPDLTAKDMTRLGFENGSKPFVRSIMTGLAGGEDHNSTSYLYRSCKPHSRGNGERVYSLTRLGRDYVAALGFETNFWSPPTRAVNYSLTFCEHQLGIVKALVSLHRFALDTLAFTVLETRTGSSLSANPPCYTSEVDHQPVTISVLPDAWVCLGDDSGQDTAIWIEVDTGSEAKTKVQNLVLHRINLVRSGQYKEYFDTDSVTFAYLVIGSQLYRTARAQMLCRYTWELLQAQKLTDWAGSILFSTIGEDLYASHNLFESAVWRAPGSDTPVPLLS
jgi:hypothetical protein